MREIGLDDCKAQKAACDAKLLQAKNTCAVITAQAKQVHEQRQEQVKQTPERRQHIQNCWTSTSTASGNFSPTEKLGGCFVNYLRTTEKKNSTERVASSGSMQLAYEVFCPKGGEKRLCEAYTFDSLGAFLYVDFFRGLSHRSM